MYVVLPRSVDTEFSFYLLSRSFLEGELAFIQGALVLVYLEYISKKLLLNTQKQRPVEMVSQFHLANEKTQHWRKNEPLCRKKEKREKQL